MDNEIHEDWTGIICGHAKTERKKATIILANLFFPKNALIDDDSIPENRSQQEQDSPSRADVAEVP